MHFSTCITHLSPGVSVSLSPPPTKRESPISPSQISKSLLAHLPPGSLPHTPANSTQTGGWDKVGILCHILMKPVCHSFPSMLHHHAMGRRSVSSQVGKPTAVNVSKLPGALGPISGVYKTTMAIPVTWALIPSDQDHGQPTSPWGPSSIRPAGECRTGGGCWLKVGFCGLWGHT